MKTIIKKWILCAALFFMVGCASTHTNPDDPLESYNRAAFGFNRAVDVLFVYPFGHVYNTLTPKPIRVMATNFFNNLALIPTVANDILQGEFKYAIVDTSRFAVNSTLGLFGALDMASYFGHEQHYTDFGLTLAKWGYKDSTYFVIPFFGPSTIRDTVGLSVDFFVFSYYYYVILDSFSTRAYFFTYMYLHARAETLDTEKLVYDLALDPYAFMRDAYLQNRAFRIEGKEAADEDPYIEP